MKRSKYESLKISLEEYGNMEQLSDKHPDSVPGQDLLVEEAKIGCLLGSLLCFNRRERLVFFYLFWEQVPESVNI